jgi:hypothetical protein
MHSSPPYMGISSWYKTTQMKREQISMHQAGWREKNKTDYFKLLIN